MKMKQEPFLLSLGDHGRPPESHKDGSRPPAVPMFVALASLFSRISCEVKLMKGLNLNIFGCLPLTLGLSKNGVPPNLMVPL